MTISSADLPSVLAHRIETGQPIHIFLDDQHGYVEAIPVGIEDDLVILEEAGVYDEGQNELPQDVPLTSLLLERIEDIRDVVSIY